MCAPRYWTVATTSRTWCRRRSSRMCSMIGRPATGTSGLGRWLVNGRSREPSPPAMTTARMPLGCYIVPSELRDLALDLTWSWEPRITRLFDGLDPELWKETGQNPIALLYRLGEAGQDAALAKPEVAAALEEARAAIREHRDRRPPFLDARAPLVVGYFSLEFGLVEC